MSGTEGGKLSGGAGAGRVDGSTGGRAAPGAGGVYVGMGTAPFKGDRLTQEVASLSSFHPISRAEGKRGQCLRAGNATDVAHPCGGRTCWAIGNRQGSLPGSAPPQPGSLPVSVSFSPSPGIRAPVTVGHKPSSARSLSPQCQGPPGLPLAPTRIVCGPTSLPPYPWVPKGSPLGAVGMGEQISKPFPTS